MNTPNLLIADDHTIIRRGITFLLESHFGKFPITETDSIKGIMQLNGQNTFTHMILDMQLQDGNVMEIFPQLRSLTPAAQILIYTMSPEEIFGMRMIKLGASGFLSKQSSEQEAITAFDLFLNGKKYVSPFLNEQIDNYNLQGKDIENPIEQLSDREVLVLSYLLKGEGIKEIATHMNLKPTTVATFKARLFDKLGVSNLIDLRNVSEIYHFKSS